MVKNELKSKRLVTGCLLFVQLFIYILTVDLMVDGAVIIPILVMVENIVITVYTIKTQIDIEREYRYND